MSLIRNGRQMHGSFDKQPRFTTPSDLTGDRTGVATDVLIGDVLHRTLSMPPQRQRWTQSSNPMRADRDDEFARTTFDRPAQPIVDQPNTAHETLAPSGFNTVQPEPESPRRARWRWLGPASLGFICGIATWHAIGFWDFMHDVAFNDDVKTRNAAISQQGTPSAHHTNTPSSTRSLSHGTNPITTGSINAAARTATAKQTVADCVVLVRYPQTGETHPSACPTLPRPLRDAGRRGRSNRAPDATDRLRNRGAWASTTDVRQTTLSPRAQPTPLTNKTTAAVSHPASPASSDVWTGAIDDALRTLDDARQVTTRPNVDID